MGLMSAGDPRTNLSWLLTVGCSSGVQNSVADLRSPCVVIRECALCHYLVAACLIAVPIPTMGSALQGRKALSPFLLLCMLTEGPPSLGRGAARADAWEQLSF